MDELLNQLYLKCQKLDEIIMYAENYIKKAPEGTLRITRNHNTEQYYLRSDPKDTYGTYISKKDKELICGLAQKDYLQKLLQQAKNEKAQIKQLLEVYEPNKLKNIYDNIPKKRKKIVTPYILPENDFVNQWLNVEYERKSIDVESDNVIVTEKGEVVRSKSEKILADKFHLMNIPYHYEKPLHINGYGTIYPDYTVLNVRTRREYYWEHFGIMHQPDYCEKAIKKIESMQRNGIFIGDKLILTFESLNHPLNIRIVEGLIKKYLL